jgi:poly(3-hydroxybutyrate) depolymerase
MKSEHQIDSNRIFVTGLSGGGAMTGVMLAAYPDVFRAGAIIAGVPYGCASTAGDPIATAMKFWATVSFGEAGWAALRCGISLGGAPQVPTRSHMSGVWRSLLGEAEAPPPITWPKVSLWHGSDDPTVNPRNLDELVEQWTAAHGVDQLPDSEEVTPAYRHKEYKDAAGDIKVETYEFNQLGHAIPVNPGQGPGTCGRAGNHITPVGVCGVVLIARFWEFSQ